MQNHRSWQGASRAEWQEVCRREAVIRPLIDGGPITHALADKAAERLGCSRSLLYRLIARYRRRPQTSSLLPARRGRASSSRLLDPKLEVLIHSAAERIYLQPEQPRVSDLLRIITAECQRCALKPPAFHTLQARLHELDQRRVVQRRLGAKAARQRYARVGVSSLQPTLPLEVVQIDHTLVDVVVVDERDRLPLRRPWLTLAIDLASRMVIGFYISLDPPSTLSVALTLAQSVLPKDLWLSDRELELEWPASGLPESLHLDNGAEFKSEALERGTREYGIDQRERFGRNPHVGEPFELRDHRL
jgi:putative transposase